MATASTIAKEVLKALLSMGMGAATRSPAGGLASSILGAAIGGTTPQAAGFKAKSYPDEFAPDRTHNYTVHTIPGKANLNSEGKSYASIIEDAGRMQELDEHNKALLQFVRPGMTPREEREAIMKGIEAEKALPAFWNESSSRVPFSVSSSCVSGIRLTPDARIEVEWKSNPGKWYTFKTYPDTYKASLAAQELLQADSIGRAVMPFQRNGVPLKIKDPSLVGYWNRKNYDPAFAK